MSDKTPQQRRKEQARSTGTAHSNGRPVNGTPRGAPAQAEESDETDENIFLFVPNLIGEHTSLHLPIHVLR